MGLAFSLLGEVDSTIYYHHKALHLRKEAESNYLMGQSYNNIGSMYYRIKEYDSALVYYERGLYYRSISPDVTESSIAESWTNLGKTWFQLGDLNKAKELLEKSLVYCERVNNLEIKKQARTSRSSLKR
jgi:tetratricopeptide (TPR) repeat protein